MSLLWLDETSDFPPVTLACADGLLAAGGDLSPARLLRAYRQGIFPWFTPPDPILWWSPDPRMVLFTDNIKISKSLAKTCRKTTLRITFDQAFEAVMHACAQPRASQANSTGPATWIHADIIQAYVSLYQQGYAHSVECWRDDHLVGGLYGVAIGQMFFGESMFSIERDSSKVALVKLCAALRQSGFPLIDCQVYSSHLESLGAECIPRQQFIQLITPLCQKPQNWPQAEIQTQS